MKTIFCIFLAAVSFAGYSQVKVYAKAGGNISFVSINDHSSSPKMGIYAGAGIQIPIHKAYGIQAEILYSQKGEANKHSASKITTRLNYISVPLLFYYNVTKNLNLHLGPELSLLVSGKSKSGSNSMDVKDIYESFDKGVALGANYTLGKFGLTLRMIKGFKGIIEITTTDTQGNEYGTSKTGSNNVLQFGVFYSFR